MFYFFHPLCHLLSPLSCVSTRNNLGTAFFQTGEHTLAKAEHREVLTLLEARNERLSHLQENEGGYDVYIETLVNLQR